MSVKVEVGKHNRAGTLAKLALRERLYVSGWDMSNYLKAVNFRPHEDDIVCILRKNRTPIGVSISRYESNSLHVFIRKSERRKGYGTQLIQTHTKESTRILKPSDNLTNDAQVEFFKKQKGMDTWKIKKTQ